MNRTKPVTLPEFNILLASAQETHSSKNEPIPQLKGGQLDQLDSCLKTPFQSFYGKDLYPGFVKKAAILFYLINKNHSLSNGNKRMACLTLAYFCNKNKWRLNIPPDEFYDVATRVTKSDPIEKDKMLKLISEVLNKHLIRL